MHGFNTAHDGMINLDINLPAWHGLDVKIDETVTTPERMLELAHENGLAYDVEHMPVYTHDGKKIDDVVAVHRIDNGDFLCTAGPKTKICQVSTMIEWFRPFLESGHVQYDTLGTIKGGRRRWILAKLIAGVEEIRPGDAIQANILLADSIDNSLLINGGFTDTRVVCANTLKIALKQDEKERRLGRIRHSSNMEIGMEQIQEVIQAELDSFHHRVARLRALAKAETTVAQQSKYFKRILEIEAMDKASIQQKNKLDKFMKEAIRQGTLRFAQVAEEVTAKEKLVKSPKTWIDSYMAGNYILNHGFPGATSKDENNKHAGRMDSMLFGKGATDDSVNFKLALEMSGVGV